MGSRSPRHSFSYEFWVARRRRNFFRGFSRFWSRGSAKKLFRGVFTRVLFARQREKLRDFCFFGAHAIRTTLKVIEKTDLGRAPLKKQPRGRAFFSKNGVFFGRTKIDFPIVQNPVLFALQTTKKTRKKEKKKKKIKRKKEKRKKIKAEFSLKWGGCPPTLP